MKIVTPINRVEFRVGMVGSYKKNGQDQPYATLLAYKDARFDMDMLDEHYEDLWKREHEVINGNLYCTVSIYNKDLNQWISRSDVGTVSNAEAEKGQASDSFKRACVNFGIGRDLYAYPTIFINLQQGEYWMQGDKYKAKIKPMNWQWTAQHDKDGNIIFLQAMFNNQVKFKWGNNAK